MTEETQQTVEEPIGKQIADQNIPDITEAPKINNGKKDKCRTMTKVRKNIFF